MTTMKTKSRLHEETSIWTFPKAIHVYKTGIPIKPATGWDEKLIIIMAGSIIQLYRLVHRVHRNHLQGRAFFF